MKTGEFESIWYDTLTDEERLKIQEIKLDVESQLNEELKLLTIRERRMMQRIKSLMEESDEKGFILTETTEDAELGFGTKGPIDLKKSGKKFESVLSQVQQIEESLTRIQDKKTRLLELKHKVQLTDDGDTGALDELVAIYRLSKNRIAKRSGKSVEEWDDEETED